MSTAGLLGAGRERPWRRGGWWPHRHQLLPQTCLQRGGGPCALGSVGPQAASPGRAAAGGRGACQTDARGAGGGRRRQRRGEDKGRERGWRPADGAPAAAGRAGRRAHPGTRGRPGGAGGRQVYLSIRLCHARGAADNFITSACKNDCRRMQMAGASQPPASAQPRAARRRPRSRRRATQWAARRPPWRKRSGGAAERCALAEVGSDC